MGTNASRKELQKKVLLTSKREAPSKRQARGKPKYYDLNDEEYKLPEVGGILANLTGELDRIQQIEIRGGKKKPSFQSRHRQKNKDVDPLEVAQIRQRQPSRSRHSQVPNDSISGVSSGSNQRYPREAQTPSEPRGDSTRSSGSHYSKSRHLQSEKPCSGFQTVKSWGSNVASTITTGLKNRWSPSIKGSSSAFSSRKRNRGAVTASARKAEEVVDLCDDDDDGGQNDHDESDGESTTTERSPEVPSSTHRSEVTSRGSTSSSRSDVSSNSPSTSAMSGDTSSASVVASAAAATAMKNSQASTLSSEDIERFAAFAQGPSRTRERFALKEADNLFPGDSSSVDEIHVNVCDTLDEISNELYTASRLSTKRDDSDLGSSQKKARTQSASRKDPPEVKVNWEASALPKKPTANEGIGIGSLTKANVNHKRKKGNGVPIVIGSSLQRNCPTDEDPIEDYSDHEEAGVRSQSKRQRKAALQRSTGIPPANFYNKSEPNSTRPKCPRQCKQKKLAKAPSSDVHADQSYGSDNEYTFDDDSLPLAYLGRAGNDRIRDIAQRKVVSKELDAVRIAIGKRVFSTRCKLKFISLSSGKGYLILSYDKGSYSTRVDHKINLDVDSLEELKYYLADEEENPLGTVVSVDFDESEELSFLAMKVSPTEINGLKKFTSAYVPHGDDVNKRYIAIEFRSNSDFRSFLNVMREDEFLNVFVTEESKLTAANADEYGRTLLEDARKERQNREKSIGSPRLRRTRKSRLGAKATNNVMVVFPFGADEEEIDGAATGLIELSSASVSRAVVSVGEVSKAALKTSEDAELTGPKPSDDAETAENDKGDSNEKAKPRAHFLTIREEENERLQPGEFLNDTLIDFWMQWIWRKEKYLEDCPVHFFTSHFYTALKEDGPKAVTSWTARKNIDVFTKKFIFIPVNQSLHWSLCCVVNPGAILNNIKALHEDPDDDELYPCILFFDSLKAHRKAAIARSVRNWLNSEWKRLEKASIQDEEGPFKLSSLLVHEPRVPYQDNSWDCGLFVCRYAHAVYSLRDCDITFGDAREGPGGRPFQQTITDSKAFAFDRDDIVRIRTELGVLIGRLSTIYKTWKAANDQAEKESKKPAARRQLLLEDNPTVNANDGKPDVTKKQEVAEQPSTRQQLSSAEEVVMFAHKIEEMSLKSDEVKTCDDKVAFI